MFGTWRRPPPPPPPPALHDLATPFAACVAAAVCLLSWLLWRWRAAAARERELQRRYAAAAAALEAARETLARQGSYTLDDLHRWDGREDDTPVLLSLCGDGKTPSPSPPARPPRDRDRAALQSTM